MSVVQPVLITGVESDGGKPPAVRRSPLAPAYFIGRPAELWIYALKGRCQAPATLTKV
jgi:hypothetical protein